MGHEGQYKKAKWFIVGIKTKEHGADAAAEAVYGIRGELQKYRGCWVNTFGNDLNTVEALTAVVGRFVRQFK